MKFHIVLLAFLLVVSNAAAQETLDTQVAKMVEELAAMVDRLSDRPLRVAVFPLTREESDDVTKFGVYLQETISTQLVRSRGFTPVNRRQLRKLLEELDFQSSDFVDESTRKKLGDFAGAELVLLGSYWDLGDTVRINAGLYGLQSADTIAAGSCTVSRSSVPSVFLTAPLVKPKPVKTEPVKVETPKPQPAKKVEKRAKLVFTSKPSGAKVYLGNKLLGKTWRPVVHYSAKGKRTFRFALAGYEDKEVTLAIKGAGTINKRVELEKTKGILVLAVEPSAALIEVGNKSLKALPGAQISLRPGKHKVKVQADGFVAVTKNVQIESNETKTLTCKLKRKPLRDSTGIELVWIPPGTFMMGAPRSDKEARDNEFPRHRVTLTKGFWMGKYEVTQQQYLKIMGNQPSHYKGRNRPVEKVSLASAQDFCRRLTLIERKTYRLPTEAEWEYACRAGSDEVRYLPARECAWTKENSRNRTRDVGRLKPNAFGLHDMLGNVFEWTQDRYGPYNSLPVTDPISFSSSHSYVGRGGCFAWEDTWARASCRYRRGPKNRKALIGFRVLREP